MRIAIVGSGPSGMLAAHGASNCGHYVDIFDRDPDQSRRNSGVFFLHEDCDLALEPLTIRQVVLGNYGMTSDQMAQAYGQKVYGQLGIQKLSIMTAMRKPVITGFSSGPAIQRLWDLYGNQVQVQSFSKLIELDDLLKEYDKIISTIPAYIWFPSFTFNNREVFIRHSEAPKHENFVFYTVNHHTPWYRCSAIDGTFTMEYDYGVETEEKSGYGLRKVTKVIGKAELPEIPNVLFTGRFGCWDKSFLSHRVYDHVIEWLIR
jgi:hypothetical protein